jgi:hypothetical protein
MGFSRTGNRTLGFVAVTLRWSLLAVVLALSGCKSVPEITGLVTGGAAGAATGSPAVGFAVGVATDAAANAGMRYATRAWHAGEQDAIAQAAADLPTGGATTWKIEHFVPIGNEHGQLRVVRVMDSPLATCKEIAFSVDEGTGDKLKREWYTTNICKQNETWKWAVAEPAVERWGFLQ